MIKISKTFETSTPESLEMGDFEETGFIFKDEEYSFLELIAEMENYIHTSSVPMDSNGWISTEHEIEDYSTDETISYSLHFNDTENKRKYWVKALRYHGLMK